MRRLMKSSHTLSLLAAVLICLVCVTATLAQTQEPQYLWTMDTAQEVGALDNDNTGGILTLDNAVVYQGTGSLSVMPSGKAPETKIGLPLAGDKLKLWAASSNLVLHFYQPETNTQKPAMFFLGMSDVTGEKWIGGVFAKPSIKPGWNEVRYVLPNDMRQCDYTHNYKVFLAFAAQEGDKKIPLTEKFYIDAIYGDSGAAAPEKAPKTSQAEITKLLSLPTPQLLEEVERQTFQYFWQEANLANGLIRDRSTETSPASIAATGFGLTAIPVAIEHHWLTKKEGYARVLTTLKSFANGGVEGKNGFFYHFINMADGRRSDNGSELSSIDTALFIAGALFCGEYFKGTEVESLAKKLYAAVDWQWMLNGGDTLSHGWYPDKGFITWRWNSFDEGLLATLLAMGSPTHPIPAKAWDAIKRPVRINYIYLHGEQLFVYQFPQVWFDLRNKEDHYANYFNNTAVATRYNRLFVLTNRTFRTYEENIWGLSNGDDPGGYKSHGASPGNHDGTVVPYASIASMPFTPDLSQAALKTMLEKYGQWLWGEYGFVSAFNVDQDWFSQEHIGIDEGVLMLMIENYRAGTVWKYFMKNTYVQRAMKLAGFVAKKADYAATPAYLAECEQQELAPSQKTAQAKQATTPMSIDGDLSDWQGRTAYLVDESMAVSEPGLLPLDTSKHKLHSSFYAAYDQNCLYLAADVTDDVVVSNIAPDDLTGFYRTDSIEFYIDPGRAGSSVGWMKLAVLPFDTAGHVQAVRHEDANPGPIQKVAPEIKIASKRTDHGYAIEVAIPFSYLGLKPKAGMILGFCHTVHNTDNPNAGVGQYARENVLAWNNIAEIWNKPEYWGTLNLE